MLVTSDICGISLRILLIIALMKVIWRHRIVGLLLLLLLLRRQRWLLLLLLMMTVDNVV
jgi:hypothetical protein